MKVFNRNNVVKQIVKETQTGMKVSAGHMLLEVFMYQNIQHIVLIKRSRTV